MNVKRKMATHHDLQGKAEKSAGKLDILSKQKVGPSNNEKHEN